MEILEQKMDDFPPDVVINATISHFGYKTVAFEDEIQNITLEGTSGMAEDDGTMEMYYLVSTLRNVFIPVIVFVGVFGNSISIAVFMSNHFRHVSASPSSFLSGLACADNIFLVMLFITWYDGSVNNILTTVNACRCVGYITYVTSFLSVWFVVCFTIERYIAICHPLHSKIICSNFRERIVVVFLSLFACCLYNYAFWTSDIREKNGKIRCGLKDKYIPLLEKLTWVDFFLTMIIPFFMIAILNLLVVRTSAKFHEKRRHCMKPTEALLVKQKKIMYSKQQIRVTRTLLLVSTTFLVLNLPSHVVRIYNLIIYLTQTTDGVGIVLYVIQEITQIIYYTTFGVNFFLYAFYGKHFRKSLAYLVARALSNCGHKSNTVVLNRTKSLTRSTNITLDRRNTFRSRFQSTDSI